MESADQGIDADLGNEVEQPDKNADADNAANNNGGILGNCGCDNGCNNGCGILGGNNSCEWLIWILLISCFCGGNNNGCC